MPYKELTRLRLLLSLLTEATTTQLTCSLVPRPLNGICISCQAQKERWWINHCLPHNGLIWPSSSPGGAGLFFVNKKEKTLLPCIYYRGINDIIIKKWCLCLIFLHSLGTCSMTLCLFIGKICWSSPLTVTTTSNSFDKSSTDCWKIRYYLKPEKCDFHTSTLSFLGFVISRLHPDGPWQG